MSGLASIKRMEENQCTWVTMAAAKTKSRQQWGSDHSPRSLWEGSTGFIKNIFFGRSMKGYCLVAEVGWTKSTYFK